MKKIIALLLAFICLTVTFAGCNKDESSSLKPSPAKDFEFEAQEDGLTVTKYVGKSKKIVIPSVVNNKKVVGLTPEAFGGNVVVQEIVLSDYMTELYLDCFKGCDNLKTITYPGFVERQSSYLNINGYHLPKNLKTMAFPSVKTIDLWVLDIIHYESSGVDTFICKAATEIEKVSFNEAHPFEGPSLDGGYNIVIPSKLLNSIKNQSADNDDLAITTAFGYVNSITVNGTTYSYAHE